MNAGTIVGVHGDDIGFITSIQSSNPKPYERDAYTDGLGFRNHFPRAVNVLKGAFIRGLF